MAKKRKVIKKETEKVLEKPTEEIKEVVKPIVVEVEGKPKQLGRVAQIDINLTYRKGSFVPQERIDLWESMGLNISEFF